MELHDHIQKSGGTITYHVNSANIFGAVYLFMSPKEYPEVDKAAWFPTDIARRKILKGQVGFLDQLQRKTGMATTSALAPSLPAEGEETDLPRPRQSSLF